MSTASEEKTRRASVARYPYLVLELKLLPWQELLVSAAMMLVLILVVVHFNVPNPNMILIAGLVVSSAVFGYNGGVLSALLMLGYSMYFFSTDHDFISYTKLNLDKLVVILIGIVVVLLFVCELKRGSSRAFREIAELTSKLQEDNELLQEVSLNDALTGIRNRLALRRDFPGYIGEDACVMMMDIDNFKSINDQLGHDQGDRILRETGHSLSSHFGQAHCYRYGGDEFLVICPDMTETDFRNRVQAMFDSTPLLVKHGAEDRVNFSVGYVISYIRNEQDLRSMITAADERLYTAKRTGKNQIVGEQIKL